MNLGVDQRLLAWTLITFGGLVAVLAKFAFKPLQQLLAEREKKIQDSLDEARKAREEAEAIRLKGAEHLDEAREAARKIIEESRKVAADAQEEGRKVARVESEAMIKRAREEIEREARRSVDSLRGTVAHISVQVAREFIKENLNEARQGQLVDDYIKRLKEEHGNPAP
jgi:F-type H+-transporting ATPase subunit b